MKICYLIQNLAKSCNIKFSNTLFAINCSKIIKKDTKNSKNCKKVCKKVAKTYKTCLLIQKHAKNWMIMQKKMTKKMLKTP